jgi:hypothetical protein
VSCGRAQDAADAAPKADDNAQPAVVKTAGDVDSETMFIPFDKNQMMKMQKGSMEGADDAQAEPGVMMQPFGAPAAPSAGDGSGGQMFAAVGKPLRRAGQKNRGRAPPSNGDVQASGGVRQNFGGAGQNFGGGMQNVGGGSPQNIRGGGMKNFGGGSPQNVNGGGMQNFGGVGDMQNFGNGAQNFGAAGQNFGAGVQSMGADDSDDMAANGNQQPSKGRRRKVKKRRTTPSSYLDANAELKALVLEKEEIERKATPKYKKALNGRLSDGQ